MPDHPIFVGLAGHSGAGKTSAAEYLVSRYGFESIRYSRVLQDWLAESNSTKVRLQEIGWAVMSSGRQTELNAQLVSRVNQDRSTVIDGLRHRIDLECLSQAFGPAFTLIFIRAGRSARLQRTASRFGCAAGFEACERGDVESFVDDLLPLSSAVISNEGSVERLHAELDGVLERSFAEADT